jgi:hypothetical protein
MESIHIVFQFSKSWLWENNGCFWTLKFPEQSIHQVG